MISDTVDEKPRTFYLIVTALLWQEMLISIW